MITLLTGSNSFELSREVARRAAAFHGEVERVEGRDVSLDALAQLLMGATLFADKRLVIVNDLSENTAVWQALPDWLERLSGEVELILVEPNVDKRTKTYKALQKNAEVKEFQPLTERDSFKAEQWLLAEAKGMGAKTDKPALRELLKRSLLPADRGQPIIDQWQAFHSLEKLAMLGDITLEHVEKYIDVQPVDSVFGAFEMALKGDRRGLHELLVELEPREDPYKVFGLLSSQVFQLATLAASDAPPSEVAKAIGAHPFALSKLAPTAGKLSKRDLQVMVLAMSEADEAMKTSKGTPWTLIEQALMKIAEVQAK